MIGIIITYYGMRYKKSEGVWRTSTKEKEIKTVSKIFKL
jgi:hypothetical protein